MYEEFKEPQVWDYPEPPDEKEGVLECRSCGRQLYHGDEFARDAYNWPICLECLKDMRPLDVYEIMAKEYNPISLYKLLGGVFDDV